VTDDGARTSVSGESAAQGRKAALGVEGPLVLAPVFVKNLPLSSEWG
jgi:hypothetical protein